MGHKSQEKAPGPAEAPELLTLAFSRPREGLARARAILAGRPAPLEASVAHHAAGMVLREFGDLGAAVSELRAAVRAARQAGSLAREADSRASLGVALVYAGRTSAGLAALDQAGRQASGIQRARILHRRAIVLWTLGRNPEALGELNRAVATLRRDGDTLWAGRALTARALSTWPRAVPGGRPTIWARPSGCSPGPAMSSNRRTWCTTGPSSRSAPEISRWR